MRVLILVSLSFYISSCAGQLKEKTANDPIEITSINPEPMPKVVTTFPQIHTNLNGIVREFVRSMYQDKKGNYWFGTNGNGIIYYDGQNLKTATYEGITPFNSIREIVEDAEGNVWFSSSDGLIKYDGLKFTKYSTELGLQNADIWGLTIDKKGLMWVGSVDGVSHFNGTTFTPFNLPSTKVENPDPMISDRLVFKFLEDKNGTMWMVNDGN